jgi:hypothetical protein
MSGSSQDRAAQARARSTIENPTSISLAGVRSAVAMQHLIPGWKFDPERPALAR